MLLVLQTIYCTFFVASFSLVVAEKNCSYPWTTLSILDFFQVCPSCSFLVPSSKTVNVSKPVSCRRSALQWSLFFTNILLLVGALRNMTVWRGKGALDMHHDYLLQADRPWKDRMRAHYIIITFWVLLEALALTSMITSVRMVPSVWDAASIPPQVRVSQHDECSTAPCFHVTPFTADPAVRQGPAFPPSWLQHPVIPAPVRLAHCGHCHGM